MFQTVSSAALTPNVSETIVCDPSSHFMWKRQKEYEVNYEDDGQGHVTKASIEGSLPARDSERHQLVKFELALGSKEDFDYCLLDFLQFQLNL